MNLSSDAIVRAIETKLGYKFDDVLAVKGLTREQLKPIGSFGSIIVNNAEGFIEIMIDNTQIPFTETEIDSMFSVIIALPQYERELI